MTEEKREPLVRELSDALMNINSAQCCFHDEPIPGSPQEIELENIWLSIYRMRNFFKEGSVISQSKGEPEKTA